MVKSIHPVATLYPPELRNALVACAKRRDTATIDLITDELARRGFCRPRHALRSADELAASVVRSRGLGGA